MAAKKVAALIVAALVAGVVLGTLGIANAGGTVALPGASADCGTCPGEMGSSAAAGSAGCPEAPEGAACGTGECAPQ
jgi:hypothetical protein